MQIVFAKPAKHKDEVALWSWLLTASTVEEKHCLILPA